MAGSPTSLASNGSLHPRSRSTRGATCPSPVLPGQSHPDSRATLQRTRPGDLSLHDAGRSTHFAQEIGNPGIPHAVVIGIGLDIGDAGDDLHQPPSRRT